MTRIAEDSPHAKLDRVQRVPLRDRLIQQMLGAIFSGAWQPGRRLVETSLAAELGVSRTPVREAISALAGLGMVELRLNHGAVVCAWRTESVREIYDVRGLLEAEATRLAATRMDPARVNELAAETRALRGEPRKGEAWAQRWFAVDSNTHQAIAEASGHARLIEEITRYRVLVAEIRRAVGAHGAVRLRAIEDHLHLLRALKNKETEKAAAAMSRHIKDAGIEACEILAGMRRK